MAHIDIRDKEAADVIDEIKFADYDSVLNAGQCIGIYCSDSGQQVEVYKKDVPNLIKALEKAFELWNDK